MTLEIALEADGEWDSSRSWEPLVRKAVEAAIAEYREQADGCQIPEQRAGDWNPGYVESSVN